MKNLILILFLVVSASISAQQPAKTSTFTVKGNCEECKEVIENAADIKGVKILVWNTKTKVATVTYQADKVTLEQIQQAIAAKGYDAGNYKGNDKAYKALPKCCKYRDAECKESQR